MITISTKDLRDIIEGIGYAAPIDVTGSGMQVLDRWHKTLRDIEDADDHIGTSVKEIQMDIQDWLTITAVAIQYKVRVRNTT